MDERVVCRRLLVSARGQRGVACEDGERGQRLTSTCLEACWADFALLFDEIGRESKLLAAVTVLFRVRPDRPVTGEQAWSQYEKKNVQDREKWRGASKWWCSQKSKKWDRFPYLIKRGARKTAHCGMRLNSGVHLRVNLFREGSPVLAPLTISLALPREGH